MTIVFSDIIAVIALLFSGFALWSTYTFNKRQTSFIENQEKLNNLLLKKEKNEAINDKRADLGANIIKLGNNDYRLKIFNKGKSTARNVQIYFPEGNDILIDSEINEKFPLESLDYQQSVELIACISLGIKIKHIIKLCWVDDCEEYNEKHVTLTI